MALIGDVLNSVGAAYGWPEYAPKHKKLFPLAPAAYARFVGTYDLGHGVVDVMQRGAALYITTPVGWGRLYPESPTTFFMLEQDSDVTFTSDASGAITGLSLAPNGMKAKKLLPYPPVVDLDSATLSGYPGTYTSDGAAIVVTLEGTHVFARLTGQLSLEIYPSAKHQFYYKVVNAQVTFTRNSSGSITALTLHQNGRDVTFPKSP